MNRELKLQIKGNSYTVKFPTVGQFNDIEIRKQQFSNGTYGTMFSTLTSQSQRALDQIDCQAFLMTLIPDLTKDLNVKSLREIDLLDFEELKRVYVDEIFPWIKEWEEALKKTDDVVKSDEE